MKVASEGEKAMVPFKNTSTMKAFSDAQKTSAIQTAELTKANNQLTTVSTKLKIAEGDLGKQIAEKTAALKQQNQANKQAAVTQDQLTESLKKQVTTINEANAQNALLRQAVKNTDVTTAQGKATVDAYNVVIDKNTKFVKDNSDSMTKQKMEIGNYSGAIENALQKTGLMNGKLGDLSKTAIGFVQTGTQAITKIKDINTSVVTGAKNIGNFTASKLGLTKATKEVATAQQIETIATGEGTAAKIGFNTAASASTELKILDAAATEGAASANVGLATAEEGAAVATGVLDIAMGVLLAPITLVVAAIALLVYVFKDFRPLVNWFKDAFAGVGAVFDMLKEKVMDFVLNIKSVGDLVLKIGDFIAHPIDSVKKLGKEMADTAVQAAKLSEASRKLESAQKDYTIAAKETENQIKTLMLQARNRTTSDEERIALLKKAQGLEEEMHNKKLSMWKQEINLQVENLRVKGKITDDEIKLLEKGDQAALKSLKARKNISTDDIEAFRAIMQKKADIDGEGIAVREKSQNMQDQIAQRAQDKADKAREKADKAREKAESDREKAQQKAESDAKKSAERAIATMKSTLDFKIASYKQEENIDSENIAFVNSVSLMKQKIAEAELRKNLIGVAKGSQDEKAIRENSANEIKKIKLEESNAIEAIQKKNAQFELELYDFRNKTLIEEGATLTDILVQQEKQRLLDFQKIHLDALAKELKIDDDKLKAKIANNDKLTENELKYLKGKEALDKQTNNSIKKNDLDLLKSKEKIIDEEVKNEVKKFKTLNKNSLAQNIFQLKEENKALLAKRKLVEKDAAKTKEIDDQVKDNKVAIEEIKKQATINSLNAGLDALISIAGQESTVGKIAATAKVTMSTIEAAQNARATAALSPITVTFPGYPALMSGLEYAAGLAQVAKINGINFFAEGTDNAPYTGKAIVDELGAELHFDENWNLKSKGSESGPRLTDIVKGDKIIPADISALLKYSMYTGGNVLGANTIDYDEIGNQFKKHLSTELRKNKSTMSMNVVVQKNISDRVTFKGKRV